MPQTKTQKRIGALYRMNATLRRYRVTYECVSGDDHKRALQRKIETLDRDIKNTRAKIPHSDLQLGF